MMTVEEIKGNITEVALRYPLKRVSLFGSYATNEQNDDSDVDLLVEFMSPAVSLFTIAELKFELQDVLNVPVDVIHSPIDPNSMIIPKRVVDLFVRT